MVTSFAGWTAQRMQQVARSSHSPLTKHGEFLVKILIFNFTIQRWRKSHQYKNKSPTHWKPRRSSNQSWWKNSSMRPLLLDQNGPRAQWNNNYGKSDNSRTVVGSWKRCLHEISQLKYVNMSLDFLIFNWINLLLQLIKWRFKNLVTEIWSTWLSIMAKRSIQVSNWQSNHAQLSPVPKVSLSSATEWLIRIVVEFTSSRLIVVLSHQLTNKNKFVFVSHYQELENSCHFLGFVAKQPSWFSVERLLNQSHR